MDENYAENYSPSFTGARFIVNFWFSKVGSYIIRKSVHGLLDSSQVIRPISGMEYTETYDRARCRVWVRLSKDEPLSQCNVVLQPQYARAVYMHIIPGWSTRTCISRLGFMHIYMTSGRVSRIWHTMTPIKIPGGDNLGPCNTHTWGNTHPKKQDGCIWKERYMPYTILMQCSIGA